MSKYLIFMIVGVLLGLLILLCMLRHRRTQRRELETKARDQLREEALNRALMNDRANEREVSAKRCLPYEVDYGQNKNSVNSLSQNKKMLHIIENSELSVRKYLFDPNQKIHIGSKSDINEIVIKDRTVSGQHCEIAVYKNEAILKDLNSTNGTYLSRRRKRIRVNSRGIKLKSGDKISVGKTDLKIEII